jgi:hypothetical protein
MTDHEVHLSAHRTALEATQHPAVANERLNRLHQDLTIGTNSLGEADRTQAPALVERAELEQDRYRDAVQEGVLTEDRVGG